MATMPGSIVIPKTYGGIMVLYSATERVEAVVDGAPPGPNGRLFIIEPGRPVRVPHEAGRFIIDHLAYTGVVRVEETETETGVSYNIDAAKLASDDLLQRMDHERFERYVAYVVDDFLNKKKPAPRTPDAIKRIIERRGYDLKKYGIFPLGEVEGGQQAQIAELQAQLKTLTERLAKKEK